jgi:tRNA-2-methylthio-N6-dimethylallyladenosine synthase
VKSERLARLFEVVETQGRAHLARLVGTKQRVLVEGPSKSGEGMVTGRTERSEIVHVAAPAGRAIVGEIVLVEITSANKHSLVGALDADAIAALPKAHEARGRRALPLVEGRPE